MNELKKEIAKEEQLLEENLSPQLAQYHLGYLDGLRKAAELIASLLSTASFSSHE